MADKSGITWTNATWGPVTGCTKVSPACKFCYAERDWSRLASSPKSVYFGRAFTNVACHPERLDQPLRWRKPRLIFVNSMSDLFHEDIPDDFIDKIYAVMLHAPWHIFQVLTKRPERMHAYLIAPERAAAWARAAQALGLRDAPDYAAPPANVWLGVSVETQAEANTRLPVLMRTPAAIRWASLEPLLGPVCLAAALPAGPRLDWVVVGGESGPKARPMLYAWARQLRDECGATGVPFFFKQTGIWEMIEPGKPTPGGTEVRFVPELEAYFSKTRGGGSDLLDGCVHAAMPLGVQA